MPILRPRASARARNGPRQTPQPMRGGVCGSAGQRVLIGLEVRGLAARACSCGSAGGAATGRARARGRGTRRGVRQRRRVQEGEGGAKGSIPTGAAPRCALLAPCRRQSLSYPTDARGAGRTDGRTHFYTSGPQEERQVRQVRFCVLSVRSGKGSHSAGSRSPARSRE